MILNPEGDSATEKPARILNEVTREDITFTVTEKDGRTIVMGMLNIGSGQQWRGDEHLDATPEQLKEEAMESICRGAGNRIYGKVRSDAVTACTEVVRILNATVGVKAEDILRVRALMEPVMEAGEALFGPDDQG